MGEGAVPSRLMIYLRLEKGVRSKFHNTESEIQSNYEKIAGMAREELSICHHEKRLWECAIIHV
ncbi:hypothetical protein KY289_036602 [Solanum tuberosum]|nr:hypothetical protein KY289_036602 [Solanum tuberosum]